MSEKILPKIASVGHFLSINSEVSLILITVNKNTIVNYHTNSRKTEIEQKTANSLITKARKINAENAL